MNRYRKTLLGLVLIAASAVPAMAETGTPVNSVVVHSMDGKTTLVPIDAARQAELLASPHTKLLTTGVVVLVANGKTYIVEDHQMPSGEMMVKTILNYSNTIEGGG